MKKRLFLWPLCAALALAGCSNETLNDGNNISEAGFSDNYLNVSIQMPASNGTRADIDDREDDQNYPDFKNGTANESKVDNVVLFFFDDNDVCVDIQKPSTITFASDASNVPQISDKGTVEVRLRTGLTYKKIAVVLNSPIEDVNTYKVEVKNFKDLESRSMDYASLITQGKEAEEKMGVGQIMSNSVYYSMNNATTKPTADKKAVLVPITENNIYTSAERPNIDVLINEGKKEYVNIYVERTVARVDVSEATFNMENYYISEANGEKSKTLTVYDYTTTPVTSKQVTIKPVVKGMHLNVLTPDTKLIKPINANEVGYNIGDGSYKNFQWNDPVNKRSYWASTKFETSDLKYFSWDDAVAQGADAFTQYINPNTQDHKPIEANETNSANTKIMVVAQLCEDGDPNKPVKLVRYGADYMLLSSLQALTADMVNKAVRAIDWKNAGLTLNDQPLSDEEAKNIAIAVNDAFVEGLEGELFTIKLLNPTEDNQPGASDWEGKVCKANDFKYEIKNTIGEGDNAITIDDALINVAKTKIDETIETSLTTINNQKIYYWNDGKTYFYTGIRHQGFPGLSGKGNDDFLYGVVRNHIYDINLEGIYGLGTPVIEPGRPINPDRPKDERPSFIKAKINILKWRVVKQNATLH